MINKKLLAALLTLLLSVSLFISCAPEDRGGSYSFENNGDKNIKIDDISEYTVIRPDLCSDTEKEALVLFRDTVNKNFGIDLVAVTDWIGEGQSESEKEILIGSTNRAESKKAMEDLGYGDYVIRKIGTKIVIAGGSDSATYEAVKYFTENYIDIYNAAVTFPEEGYKHTESYTLSSVTINGTPISEYKLFTSDPEIDLSDVQSTLSEVVAGASLEIEENFSEHRKYIIFDRTSFNAHEYGVKLDGDNLMVYGSYASFETAKEYFKGEYLTSLSESKNSEDIDITWHDDRVLYTEKRDIYTKEALLNTLTEIYSQKTDTLMGENVGGGQTSLSYTLEKFREETGSYSGISGIDLGAYGLPLKELSAAEWSEAICSIVSYAENGGIISLGAAFENPTGNWPSEGKCYGELGDDAAFKELVTEKSELNTKLNEELSLCTAFIKALSDNGVPVLWQPLSECNSDKYWYGALQNGSSVNAESVKMLWRYIYEYFSAASIDNVIWVYSPDITAPSPMDFYPGDEYTDIIGASVTLTSKGQLEGCREVLSELSGAGKPLAVSGLSIEVGSKIYASTREEQSKLYSCAELLSELRELRSAGLGITYLLTSGSASSVSWLGEGGEIAEDERILTLDDINEGLYK